MLSTLRRPVARGFGQQSRSITTTQLAGYKVHDHTYSVVFALVFGVGTLKWTEFSNFNHNKFNHKSLPGTTQEKLVSGCFLGRFCVEILLRNLFPRKSGSMRL